MVDAIAIPLGTVVLEHNGARLLQFDLTSHRVQLQSAVDSVDKDAITWYPTFKNPYNCHETATMRRGMAFFMNPIVPNVQPGYYFSGVYVVTLGMTPEMQAALDVVNRIFAPAPGQVPYDGVLLNYYNTKSDYLSQHSDKGIKPGEDVVMISLGPGIRIFRVTRKQGLKVVFSKDFVSSPFRALVMTGDSFQQTFQHGIPKLRLRASDFPEDFPNGVLPESADMPRLSMTFRRHDAVLAARDHARFVADQSKKSP